jgi:hypothetical protein
MNKTQKALVGGTILAAVLAGGAFGAALTGSATAANGTMSAGARAGSVDDDGHRDPSQGGHVGRDGTAEELLTGDTAARVTAAVTAEHPDATIQRVETDAEGNAYEAHVVLADGTRATVKLDGSFTVTRTEKGH